MGATNKAIDNALRFQSCFLLSLLIPVFLGSRGLSAGLSTGLRAAEVEKIIDALGSGGAARLLRTAEPYESFPGLKLGFETVLIPSRGIGDLGNADGSVPGILPNPRFFLAKGLFLDLELILSVFPATMSETISNFGLITKWTFMNEDDGWLAGALYLGFTSITAMKKFFNANDVEFGAVFSKDYVRLKPFFGGGFLVIRGTIARELVPVDSNSSFRSMIHLFGGAELQGPVDITFQFDLMNLNPMGSLSLGKKF